MKFRCQTGASAVEFAIILPLLVLLVFGIIEFGFALYDKAMITNASREGARQGTVYRSDNIIGSYSPLTDAQIEDVVKNYLEKSGKTFLVTFNPAGSSAKTVVFPLRRDSGDLLYVTVTYHYDFLVLPNFIAKLIGGVDLSAQTVMRME